MIIAEEKAHTAIAAITTAEQTVKRKIFTCGSTHTLHEKLNAVLHAFLFHPVSCRLNSMDQGRDSYAKIFEMYDAIGEFEPLSQLLT